MRRPSAYVFLSLPLALLLGIGVVTPFAGLGVLSFFQVENFVLHPALSGRAWSALAHSPAMQSQIGKALGFGCLTALTTAIAGYPVALTMSRLPSAFKSIAVIILLTPLYCGEIVRIYAWRLVLGGQGFINTVLSSLNVIDHPIRELLFTPVSVVIVLFYNNLPFMVLALWSAVEMLDRRLLEAARDLGGGPLTVFFRIVLPLTGNGLAAGMLAVFALSAGDALTPALLGGTSGSTAMGMIENLFGVAFDWPLASALSLGFIASLAVAATVLAAPIYRHANRYRGAP